MPYSHEEGMDPRLRPLLDAYRARHGAHLLLQHCVADGLARIGFHANRDQRNVLAALAAAGFKKPFLDNARDFIRLCIVGQHEAFDACRPYILFESVLDRQEVFWDGFGMRVSGQSYFDKDVLVDVTHDAAHLCVATFENR